MTARIFFFCSCFGLFLKAGAQSTFDPIRPQKRVVATKIDTFVVIDGMLNETAWERAAVVSDFGEIDPVQGGIPGQRTEIKLLYNKDYLYIAAICSDSVGKKGLRVPDFQRDFNPPDHDHLAILIDGFHDTRNAMAFLVNPYGVQRDVLCFDNRLFDVNWDGLWKVRTHLSDSGWIAEIAIPWKTLRYPDNGGSLQTWGINFVRKRRTGNSYYSWSPFPREYSLTRMTYEGLLDSLSVPTPGTNVRVQPYALTNVERDHRGSRTDVSFKTGGDVKWALKTNQVLDLTVNTDFAQADVDQQVNNLQRFSVSFPEKRPFFLENASLLQPGLDVNPDGNKQTQMTIQPFFSRKIGLDGAGNPINIRYGGRYVYRGDNQAAALMAIRESPSDSAGVTDFLVGRFTHTLGKSVQLGAMVTSRMQKEGVFKGNGSNNWSATLDAFYRIDQKWQTSGMLSGTNGSGASAYQKGVAGYGQLFYKDNLFTGWFNESFVSRNYNPGVGFVNRSNVICTSPGFYFTSRGKWLPSFIRGYGPGMSTDFLHTLSTGKLEEARINIWPVWFEFPNGGYLGLVYQYCYQVLSAPFQPLNATILPGKYNYGRPSIEYSSDASRRCSVYYNLALGGYYDGSLLYNKVTLRWSLLPMISLSGGMESYAIKDLGAGRLSATYYLYNLQTRLAWNPRLQLTAFYQHNTSNASEALNVKFAWEYKPLSYVYLVWNTRNMVNNGAPDQMSSAICKVSYLKQF